jgi:S-adenosylmethionine hydrolase
MANGPIITLTTDFGLTDFYVAALKAVLLYYCPNVTLIDITHQIPRHDLRSGSFTLERAISSFPENSIHLAVVDPGVGTDRRLMVADVNGSRVICPDNGLITWAWRNHPDSKANQLTWRPAATSNTFHGRDIMAPVAGMIAAGYQPGDFTGAQVTPVLLEMHPSTGTTGEVIHTDHFGNATTNIPASVVTSDFIGVTLGNAMKFPIRRTYGEVAIGDPLALVGSSNLLEIAIRNGSAVDQFQINIGDSVLLF